MPATEQTHRFRSAGGIQIDRSTQELDASDGLGNILQRLNSRRGAVFASGYEYPGRYSRWDIGFADPPLELVSRQRDFTLRALNARGKVLLGFFGTALDGHDHIDTLKKETDLLRGSVKPMPAYFPEEERSKQPTVFSVLRAIQQLMAVPEEPHLGFYGAFGYDLVFQFEPIQLRHERPAERPDLHLFLPDDLIVIDHRKEQARRFCYDFTIEGASTSGLSRDTGPSPYVPGTASGVSSDHAPGEYADKVRKVIAGTRRGDYFEVVPSQVLSAGYAGTPQDLFESIRRTNPSPYEFLINLGAEFLVGASPEMFVRVEDGRIETCPIAGTIRRGDTPLEDADRILELLNSAKDEAELTMCTDVDRNDKARVCQAGSVEVLGRRLIETYSRLIHTVDYVVGQLRDGFDGFDALLSHMWAVTLTGAPKPAAMQQVEDLENSARRWYGGCVGMLLFNGQVNTGITIRTVHLEDGEARVRVGATLLCDSDPDDEERETRTKAEAFINAVLGRPAPQMVKPQMAPTGKGKKVLFVDNRDSFVHTLGDYMRQTGADITTVRAGFPAAVFDQVKPDLVFVSPGPGTPQEFGVPDLVRECVARKLPVFGVCLGLQGMVEAFGGNLGVLSYPMHGKESTVHCSSTGILAGFPAQFKAGRYHSLYAIEEDLPDCFEVLARTEDGIIMALEHRDYPAAAVQFHPESILSLKDEIGHRLIERVIERLAR
jgi:anthranilate synthase